MASARMQEAATARAQERAALAEAIAERDAIAARIAEVERRMEASWQSREDAERDLAAAESSLAEATADGARWAAGLDVDFAAGAVPTRERRDAVQDARDTLNAHTAGRDLLEREKEHLTGRLTIAKVLVDDRITSVVRADPATRRLLEQHAAAGRRLADLDAAVQRLRRHGMIAPEDCRLLALEVRDARRERAWRAALEQLATDADAPLPIST